MVLCFYRFILSLSMQERPERGVVMTQSGDHGSEMPHIGFARPLEWFEIPA